MRLLTILLLVTLAGSGAAVGGEADERVQVLRSAAAFTTRTGGRSLKPTQTSEALVWLVRHNRAADLMLLTRAERPAARLYGLCGLRQLNVKQYSVVRSSLARQPDKVSIVTGCIGHEISLADALASAVNVWSFDGVCDTLKAADSSLF